MGIFNFIPWKSAAGLLPVVVQIIKEARGFVKEDERGEVAELRGRVKSLEQGQEGLYRFVRFAVFGGIALFMISVAALVLGIVALTR